MRLLVLNNELYRIKEKDFKRITKTGRRTFEEEDLQHIENCDTIRKLYKPIKEIDLILRDD